MKGVILDAGSLGSGIDLQPLAAVLDHFTIHETTRPEQTLERIGGHEVVITNKVVIDASHFSHSPEMAMIACTATGTNNLDLAAATTAGVRVCNVQDYGTATLVQHTFSLILALSNSLLDYVADVRRGRWQEASTFCLMDHPIRELAGKTLGIVGYGTIGKAVAQVAEAFGLQVLVAARPGSPPPEPGGENRLPLAELLHQVDILSLHCMLSEENYNLIDAKALALMKPDALLINTARGGLVDEAALADALRAGRLGGAATDVLSSEPPVDGNPLLANDIPRLIVTPHCAWASHEARQRLVDLTAENIRRFMAGETQPYVV